MSPDPPVTPEELVAMLKSGCRDNEELLERVTCLRSELALSNLPDEDCRVVGRYLRQVAAIVQRHTAP